MAVGFLFVIIFYKGGSLIPCILTHSLVNALSVIQNAQAMQGLTEILISVVIIVVAVSYSIYILKCVKPKNSSNYNNMLDDGFTE
jgi:membrane protease YdiL (CAAX protease family)